MSNEKDVLSLYINKNTKTRITNAVAKGHFRGITSVSGLVEKLILDALDQQNT